MPAAAVVLWMTVIGALCVIPYFMLHGNAVTVAAYEAGIGTVPLLMVYVLISVVTPVRSRPTARSAWASMTWLSPPPSSAPHCRVGGVLPARA